MKKVEDFISSNEQGIKNPTPSLTRVNGLLVEKISEKFLQKELYNYKKKYIIIIKNKYKNLL